MMDKFVEFNSTEVDRNSSYSLFHWKTPLSNLHWHMLMVSLTLLSFRLIVGNLVVFEQATFG